MEERRQFIKKSMFFGLACGIAPSLLLTSCKTAKMVPSVREENNIKVLKSHFENEAAVIINEPSIEAPIYIAKKESEFIALLMLCTHKACDVTLAGKVFTCPCHGSEFSTNGEVLVGPATEKLHSFKTTIDTNYVYIQL